MGCKPVLVRGDLRLTIARRIDLGQLCVVVIREPSLVSQAASGCFVAASWTLAACTGGCKENVPTMPILHHLEPNQSNHGTKI